MRHRPFTNEQPTPKREPYNQLESETRTYICPPTKFYSIYGPDQRSHT